MRWTGLAALAVPALLAGAAIGNATGAGDAGGPVVVAVEARGERTATGFATGDGRIVTVAHALGDRPVFVRGSDGVARPATVLRRDEQLDLAVLAVRALPSAPAAEDTAPRLGTGAPTHTVVRRDGTRTPAAIVRRIDARVRGGDGRLVARRPAFELRAAIGPGDSGAPLLGPDGRVAGVVFARSRERPGVAYAVDASVLDALLR